MVGDADLEGVTVFHTSVVPLFVQVTKSLPDFAVAPTLAHLLPGVFVDALAANGVKVSSPMSNVVRVIEYRFMNKKLLWQFTIWVWANSLL